MLLLQTGRFSHLWHVFGRNSPLFDCDGVGIVPDQKLTPRNYAAISILGVGGFSYAILLLQCDHRKPLKLINFTTQDATVIYTRHSVDLGEKGFEPSHLLVR